MVYFYEILEEIKLSYSVKIRSVVARGRGRLESDIREISGVIKMVCFDMHSKLAFTCM